MKLNQITICYYSPTHSSKKIAQSIADGLQIARRREIDLTTDTSTSPISIQDSICIVAVPVYGGLVAPVAAQRIRRIKAINSVVIPVVVYGNRDYEDALIQLRDMLQEQGFVPFCGAAFIGEHSYSRPEMPIAENRPDDEDLKMAEDFGEKALGVLLQHININEKENLNATDFSLSYQKTLEELLPSLNVKGNKPYKTLRTPTPQAPVVDESCYGCGDCIDWCPTKAISMVEGHSTTRIDLCTKCCACVKFCPIGARTFDTPYTAMLHEKCKERRRPEIFL